MISRTDQYKKRIIYHLYFGGLLSCASISHLSGKSISLISKLLQSLVKDGVVVEGGQASSSGGRRAQLYGLQPDVMYTIAVAVDQYVVRVALVNMHQQVVGNDVVVPVNLKTSINIINVLTEVINRFINEKQIDKKHFLGIGVSMPGFIRGDVGLNYSYVGANKNIIQIIEKGTGLRTFLDNDSSVIALAEQKFGEKNDTKNALVLNIGWGIGLGIILNNELYRGQEGMAGEFSHLPLFDNNKLCICGKVGCLETEGSLKAIIDNARNELSIHKTSAIELAGLDNYLDAFEYWVAAVKHGDSYAISKISEVGYFIGRALSVLIHIMNPKKIVLSGRGAIMGKALLPPLQKALNEHCIPRLAADIEISISKLHRNAQLIGSAALVVYKNI